MGSPAQTMLTVTVKYGKETLLIEAEAGWKVQNLMEAIQKVTNVHPRGQKLIHKGKILAASSSLKDAGLETGSKIMLMASAGVHQGASNPPTKAVAPKVAPPKRPRPQPPLSISQEEARKKAWEQTGIVSFHNAGLDTIPSTAWKVGEAVRVLDLGGNVLQKLPPLLGHLANLQRLRLSHNQLTSDGVPWEALCSLRQLTILALDHNRLLSASPLIGHLQSLRHLNVSHNQLETLPEEIGRLTGLERLEAASNKLKELPAALGNCSSLVEADFGGNFVDRIPSSFRALLKLKTLRLSNNGISAVPPEVLRDCASLCTLALHGNPITVENLRETESWAVFDERRKEKYGRQLDFSVLGPSEGFDEGADAHQWQHF